MAEGRENDLVLAPNQYAFVLDETKGQISCVVGPHKMSLSASDQLVSFNEHTKEFEKSYGDQAIQLFISAPENWYVVLKNPTINGNHPIPGSSNTLPELEIGKKINIPGNCSFALFPGQMAKVIAGHRMHSNQYLKARVYDADVLNKKLMEDYERRVAANNETDEISELPKKPDLFVVGQILIIKGSEMPFYIPPTGIEVLPIGGRGYQYVRDALTLTNMEYCILIDESGNKSYISGPAVVFPRPNQVFIKNPDTDTPIFRAIELTETSGILIKYNQDCVDTDGGEYKAGEERFLRGDETPIYFPRPEHEIISYGDRKIHYAIAIPKGEGRYVLNRLTGEVKTVHGPVMYLPDPRFEVITQRFLTDDQCALWYPGNEEVLRYNHFRGNVDEFEQKEMNFMSSVGLKKSRTFSDDGISRNTSYTPPRTVVLDNKFNGCVTICVRTGYAIMVVSKDGTRKVVTGPKTVLLEYDETLEVLELSTGKPKTTDNLIRQVYLRVDNNKIADIISVQTKDFVDIDLKLSYCVNFLPQYEERWFSIENYVKYLCDRMRTLLKSSIRNFTFEEFYEDSDVIIRNTVLNLWGKYKAEDQYVEVDENDNPVLPKEIEEPDMTSEMLFEENGMFVSEVEILSIRIDSSVKEYVDSMQRDILQQSLDANKISKEYAIQLQMNETKKLSSEADKQLKEALEADRVEVNRAKSNAEDTINKMIHGLNLQREANALAVQEERRKVREKELETERLEKDQELDLRGKAYDLELRNGRNQAENLINVFNAISDKLIAAMTESSNRDLIESVVAQVGPYALADNREVIDVVNLLLRGTPLEEALGTVWSNVKEATRITSEVN